MTRSASIIASLDDPALFAGMFDDPSWGPWRAFLHALQARPMGPEDLLTYQAHTGRIDPPTKPARYAELVVGRRGGKSRILALVAVWLACIPDHSAYLAPGEIPVVAIIAKDRQQAKVILSYVVGFLRSVPALAPMLEDEFAEQLRLSNGVSIEIHTASISSPRGRTFLAVLCDEIAFWQTSEGSNPDHEIITAVRPGLSTIPYSLLLIASSPYARQGALYQNHVKHFGVEDAPILVWQATTEQMNRNMVGDPLIAEMYDEDPSRAAAEFGAQFRRDVESFITKEAIDAAVVDGRIELPPVPGVQYAAFTDPAGGSGSELHELSAIAHKDGEIAILDLVREIRPPFSPDATVKEFADVLKRYHLQQVTGDLWGSEFVAERFRTNDIRYVPTERTKSAIYRELLPLLNSGGIELLDVQRLTTQLSLLERKTARGGKDSIDHPRGGRDDVINAAGGALVLASGVGSSEFNIETYVRASDNINQFLYRLGYHAH